MVHGNSVNLLPVGSPFPKKRSIFAPEFNIEAVKLITGMDDSVAEASRTFDIRDGLFKSWRISFAKEREKVFPGKSNPAAI